MEEEDDDDFYAPTENVQFSGVTESGVEATKPPVKNEEEGKGPDDGEEEGEEIEEEEESDSDIDIITDRKPDDSSVLIQPARVSKLKVISERPPSTEPTVSRGSPTIKNEPSGREIPTMSGASYPAIKTSTVDVDIRPVYEPNGKPITDIDMDADFPEDDKPWRRPGTDMTDYFNYGFDEFTWASYCLKQNSLRKEVTDSKKQMDDMQSFLTSGMPAMPGIPGAPGGAAPGMPPMGGPADFPPEMQQMMGQMMSQGMDPSQMDPAMFVQMMQGGQGGAGGDVNRGFGGQGFGQQDQSQQQMGYWAGGGGGGGGGRGGRGRGRW